ncbi:transposase [Acidocella aminolytica 101 = DSM 11237]|jgi:hypothetical protein|nr:transposase [Acidocella aminolytica 101 = DSM 11237]
MLMEQINYNLLYRWFVELSMDASVWHSTGFTHNRDRLLQADVARAFLQGLLALKQVKRLLSSEHFSVDGTLIDAWCSMKSFVPKNKGDEPPAPPAGRNAERDFRGETRSNETHASTTGPDARLYRKSQGQPAGLCYMGHVLMENRNDLVLDSTLPDACFPAIYRIAGTLAGFAHATGTAERDATLTMLDRRTSRQRITLGADKAYDVADFMGELSTRKVTPHIAINGTVYKTGTRRKSAIDGRTTRHPGYEISLRCRKRIKEVFGWEKASAGLSKFKVKSQKKADAVFTFFAAAFNLVRLPNLLSQQPA